MLRFCHINTKGSSFCLVPISIYNWHYLDSFYIDHLLLKLLQLLEHFKVSEPWTPSYSVHKVPNNAIPLKKPTDFSSMELEQELFKLFLSTRFRPRYVFCLVPFIFVSNVKVYADVIKLYYLVATMYPIFIDYHPKFYFFIL